VTSPAQADERLHLPRTSVYAQLRQTPRVFAFMALLLGGAISLGAKEVARWEYLDEAFDSEWGLGSAAAVTALVMAVTSLIVGGIIDRRDPRPFVIMGLSIAAVGNLVVAFVLIPGPISPGWIVLSSLIDGATLGLGGVAMLKMQAAMVRPGAEGAAEIANILRLGVGGVVGALLGGLSPDPTVTLIVGSVLLLATCAGLWWVMRPVTLRPSARGRTGVVAVLGYLRRAGSLRGLVIIDLALAFVIPTQLVNLVLVGMDAPQVATLSIAAGMVGVLVGRLALAILGFRGDPRRLLTIVVVGLAVTQLLAAVALTDGWLIDQLLVLPTVIIIGSVFSTYAQGVTASIIQQEVEEDHRGGLASILVAGRNILISIAALGGAALAVAWGPQVFITVLALGLLVVLVLSRRFAAVPS
jgi:MFS family permease